MRIRKLSLRQFRCFASIEFVFADSVSAAVGTNGSGKTALLEAIAVVLGAIVAELQDTESPRPLGTDDQRIVTSRTVGAVRVAAIVELDGIEGNVAISFDGDRSITRITPRLRAHIQALRNNTHRTIESTAPLPLLRYFRAGRLWFGELGAYADVDANEFHGYAACLDPSNVTEALLREVAAMTGTPPAVADEFAKCIEDLREPGERQWDVTLDWLADAKSGHVILRALPDGIRSIVLIVADLLVRRHALNGPIRVSRGVVLIDEIDLHLHPLLQRSVVEMLRRRFSSIQFVITTHSPFVLRELEAHEIMSLSGGSLAPGGSIEDIAEELMGVELPQRSKRQQHLEQATNAYFSALERNISEAEISVLRAALNEALRPFADGPALLALLSEQSKAITLRRR